MMSLAVSLEIISHSSSLKMISHVVLLEIVSYVVLLEMISHAVSLEISHAVSLEILSCCKTALHTILFVFSYLGCLQNYKALLIHSYLNSLD